MIHCEYIWAKQNGLWKTHSDNFTSRKNAEKDKSESVCYKFKVSILCQCLVNEFQRICVAIKLEMIDSYLVCSRFSHIIERNRIQRIESKCIL